MIIWASTWQNQRCGCAPSEDSDQPGHPPSLIRVFAVRMKKAWVLSYPSSAQRTLWSDWADAQADLSLRWAHTHFVVFVMSWLIKRWFSIFLHTNMLWALTRIGDSKDCPKHRFLLRTPENYPFIIINYPPYLFQWDCIDSWWCRVHGTAMLQDWTGLFFKIISLILSHVNRW